MEYPLREYYKKYLVDVRLLSISSVNHYIDAINWISKFLVKRGLIKESLYEILDLDVLEQLVSVILADSEFYAMNKRGHQMYTSGLNNYLRFAKGEGFDQVTLQSSLMDIPLQTPNSIQSSKFNTWQRSGIIKEQSLEMARYECEVDSRHKTFIASKNGKQYMEGHHAIPMRLQESFNTSLDVYANIVCVCPICHRLLHYGQSDDKQPVLNKIYYMRSDRLANSGIRLSCDDFIDLAI